MTLFLIPKKYLFRAYLFSVYHLYKVIQMCITWNLFTSILRRSLYETPLEKYKFCFNLLSEYKEHVHCPERRNVIK